MATVNLRPWREERSKERQKHFLMNMFGVALFAGAIILGVGYYFDLMHDRQMERNNYLKNESARLDKQLKAIKELKAKKDRLLSHLNTIQTLQASRPLIVRNFDELVKVLPNGVYYSSVTRKGIDVDITGLAEEKLDVSNLMRNFEHSIWFGEPVLSNVKLAPTGLNQFSLSLPVKVPETKGGKK